MRLCDLPHRQKACVTHVEGTGNADPLSQRLQDIGFVPGEQVTVVARAPWGGDPVLIQVGGQPVCAAPQRSPNDPRRSERLNGHHPFSLGG